MKILLQFLMNGTNIFFPETRRLKWGWSDHLGNEQEFDALVVKDDPVLKIQSL